MVSISDKAVLFSIVVGVATIVRTNPFDLAQMLISTERIAPAPAKVKVTEYNTCQPKTVGKHRFN
jgi:hypothetical protein